MILSTPQRVLIVSRSQTTRNLHGSGTHMADFMSYLENHGFDVRHLCTVQPNEKVAQTIKGIAPPEAVKEQKILVISIIRTFLFIWKIFFPSGHPINFRIRNFLNKLSGKIRLEFLHPLRPYLGRTEIENFTTAYRANNPDIVIADYAEMAEIFDAIPAEHSTKKIIFLHDLRTRISSGLRQLGLPTDQRWNKYIEAFFLRKAHAILVLQNEDGRICKQMAPKAVIIRIKISMPIMAADAIGKIPARCLYVASGGDENEYAIRWFLVGVWPRVKKAIPESTMTICGKICERIESVPDGVTLAGRVDDLNPFYTAAQLCIVPHIMQGGMKLKAVEALAHGCPVVANMCGMEGLEEAIGKCALIADNPEDFAAHVIAILSDKEKRQVMQAEALEFSRRNFSPETAYGDFLTYLRKTS